MPGVGYPNPNRSHFESMAIWQTARLDPEEHGGPGWIGRSFDAQRSDRRGRDAAGAAVALHRRRGDTRRFARPRAGAASLERIEDLTLPTGWDRSMPATPLGARRRRTTA